MKEGADITRAGPKGCCPLPVGNPPRGWDEGGLNAAAAFRC